MSYHTDFCGLCGVIVNDSRRHWQSPEHKQNALKKIQEQIKMKQQEQCPYTVTPVPCPDDCAKCPTYLNITTRLMPIVRMAQNMEPRK